MDNYEEREKTRRLLFIAHQACLPEDEFCALYGIEYYYIIKAIKDDDGNLRQTRIKKWRYVDKYV